MTKIKLFIISLVISLLFSTTVFATIADAGESKTNDTDKAITFDLFVFEEANLGVHIEGNIFAKTIINAKSISPRKDQKYGFYMCSNYKDEKANPPVIGIKYYQPLLDSAQTFYESFVDNCVNIEQLKVNDKGNTINNIDLNIDTNSKKLYFYEIPKNVTEVTGQFTVNGKQLNDYDELYTKIFFIYKDDGELNLNINKFGGQLIAPRADLSITGCGNFNGSVVCTNFDSDSEFHGMFTPLPLQRIPKNDTPSTPDTTPSTPDTTPSTPDTTPSTPDTPSAPDNSSDLDTPSTPDTPSENSTDDGSSEIYGKGGGDDSYIDNLLKDPMGGGNDPKPYEFTVKTTEPTPIPKTSNPNTGTFFVAFIPTFLVIICGLIVFVKKKIIMDSEVK